jgi:hypothetical protein
VTKIKVVEECGRYRLHTMAGNVIGPRLYGSRPPTGFPPLDDLFETLEAANEACNFGTSTLFGIRLNVRRNEIDATNQRTS